MVAYTKERLSEQNEKPLMNIKGKIDIFAIHNHNLHHLPQLAGITNSNINYANENSSIEGKPTASRAG